MNTILKERMYFTVLYMNTGTVDYKPCNESNFRSYWISVIFVHFVVNMLNPPEDRLFSLLCFV